MGNSVNHNSTVHIAFKFTLAAVVSIFVYKYFRINHGYWILMTVCMLYSGSQRQGMVVKYAVERFIGTFAGLVLAFWYIRIFMYADYRYAYIFPVILFCIFLFLQNNIVKTLFSTVLVVLILSISSGRDPNMKETLFERMVCTGIAGMIVIFVEFLIFRTSNQAHGDVKKGTKTILMNVSEAFELIVKAFTDGRCLEEQEEKSISEMVEKYFSTQKLTFFMKYEMGGDIKNREFYVDVLKLLKKMCFFISGMIALCRHNEAGSISEEEKDDILTIAGMVRERTQQMIAREKFLKEDIIPDLREKIVTVLDRENIDSLRFRPIFLFKRYIINIAESLDDFTCVIYEYIR